MKLSSLPGNQRPDWVLVNGRFHTMDPEQPRASVLAARGQQIIYVGDHLGDLTLGPAVEIIDLQGLTIVPGLFDSHAHLIGEGLKLAELDIREQSREELLTAVAAEARRRPAGEWIIGYGWNQESWPGQSWPTKEELDAAAPDHPVVLDRIDKHSIWVNSRALEAAGLASPPSDPPGGEFVRTKAGELAGVLIGQAMWAIKNHLPAMDDQDRRRAFLRTQAEMLGYGITSVTEAALRLKDLAVLRQLYESGEMRLRTRAFLWANNGQDREYLNQGNQPVRGLYDDRLSVDGVKIIADGSLGSRSAWLLEDYADRPGHRGHPFYTDEDLLAIMKRARTAGLTMAVHAIGDATVRQVIQAMSKALGSASGDHRWRLEHFQVAAEADLERALKLGLVFSLQTVGLMTDLAIAEERLGTGRLEQAYAWRKILDRGGRIINGADGPIEPVNPFWGLHAAVTRQTLAGRPPQGWRPEHRLSRWEALASYTVWPAWAEFSENRKGRFRPGFLADLAVLDRDYFTCPIGDIKHIRARAVISGHHGRPEEMVAGLRKTVAELTAESE